MKQNINKRELKRVVFDCPPNLYKIIEKGINLKHMTISGILMTSLELYEKYELKKDSR